MRADLDDNCAPQLRGRVRRFGRWGARQTAESQCAKSERAALGSPSVIDIELAAMACLPLAHKTAGLAGPPRSRSP